METVQIIVAVIFGGAFVLILACSMYFNVFEKENSKGKSSEGGFWKFILAIVLVLLAFGLISMCGGDGMPWSPRHT